MVQHHRCEKDWESSPKADAIKKVIAAYHTDEVKKSSKKHQTVWINQFGNKETGRWERKIPPSCFCIELHGSCKEEYVPSRKVERIWFS